HLEGRTAAFFCYGDGGGDELDEKGRPTILLHPEWFDPHEEPYPAQRFYYGPLVWQCRYSGIQVPDELWTFVEFGHGKKYSDNQAEDMDSEPQVYREFEAWCMRFAEHVARKGKIEPGRWRAFGYKAPGHFLRDAQLKWRDIRMRIGHPHEHSSPAKQQRLGLNKDATLSPKTGEGEKLRE
ncbi:MAG TPA: hypothetical protein VE486_04350, partial [Candidatus Baltobacteraceae bacterium]|nr:hypothetical protein [Candidatus Baltobacteraceae bacterium]